MRNFQEENRLTRSEYQTLRVLRRAIGKVLEEPLVQAMLEEDSVPWIEDADQLVRNSQKNAKQT